MIDILATTTIVATALYFVALGAVALAVPENATRFLQHFASSARAHYVELTVRLAIGVAFLLRASALPLPQVFTVFGGCLVITTACLFAVPWRWHRRFAERTVPRVTRHLRLFAVACLLLGSLVLAATLAGSAA